MQRNIGTVWSPDDARFPFFGQTVSHTWLDVCATGREPGDDVDSAIEDVSMELRQLAEMRECAPRCTLAAASLVVLLGGAVCTGNARPAFDRATVAMAMDPKVDRLSCFELQLMFGAFYQFHEHGTMASHDVHLSTALASGRVPLPLCRVICMSVDVTDPVAVDTVIINGLLRRAYPADQMATIVAEWMMQQKSRHAVIPTVVYHDLLAALGDVTDGMDAADREDFVVRLIAGDETFERPSDDMVNIVTVAVHGRILDLFVYVLVMMIWFDIPLPTVHD